MSTNHYKRMATKLIEALRLHGYSDAYIEAKVYQHHGGKVGMKFIVDTMK
jgi:hypothetical protein